MVEDAKINTLLSELVDVIVACDADGAKSKAEELVAAGVDPVVALKEVLDKASKIVG